MNYLIIIAFIVLIVFIIVAIFPKQVALYLSGVNKYDLLTVPRFMGYLVFITSVILISISMFVLLYETSLIEFVLPNTPAWWDEITLSLTTV